MHERRDVDETPDASRGVDGEARQLAPRAERPRLEEIVHQPARHVEVVDHPGEAATGDLREELRPSLGRRLHQPAVEDVVVEGEHALVEGLPRVVVRLVRRVVRGRGVLPEVLAPYRATGCPGRDARRAAAADGHAGSHHESDEPHGRNRAGRRRILHLVLPFGWDVETDGRDGQRVE